MKVQYNNFTLSDLGEVILTQRREFAPGDAPQRAKVILMLKVMLFERSYADNYALLNLAKAALAMPNAVLLWQNEDSGETYINQTATLTQEDFPEEWGTYFQELNCSFTYYENLDTSAQNLPLTFTPAGGTPITFDRITTFTDGLTNERFSSLRKQRKETRGRVEVAGAILGDPLMSISDRRKVLAAAVTKLRAAMNSAQGRLTFGLGDQQMFDNAAVRITDFKCDINQAINGIDFSFTGVFTLFPNEANYATVEATADEKDNFTGETTLNVTGKIQAQTEAAARVKLAAVLASFLAQYGYAKGQPIDINTTANLISANADGDTFTELSFNGSWRKWRASNQTASFKKTGGTVAIPFGNVKLWEDGYKAERFDQMRSERRHSTGTVSATGTYPGDMTLSLKDRRAALLALQRRMKAECNSAEGVLVYGDWSQVVRIEEFIAHVNQTETGIDWAFQGNYSMFPNEGGYATCEFNADTRDDVETGDRVLAFSGEILAPNGALARAKLNSLRIATLGIYGFTVAQQLRSQTSTHEVSANGDATSTVPEGIETAGDVAGVTFLRLSFNEEYRQRMPGTIVSSQYSISSRDDTTTGLLLTTYSGAVTATGVSADAATAAAITRAMAIGANKETVIDATAFLKASSLTLERRQATTAVPEEFVRLSFSYEYQSKLGAGRSYLEMNTSVTQDSFGPDSESVSGFVVAKDFVTATAIYKQQVKAIYAGRLIRNETLTQNQVQAELTTGAAPGIIRGGFGVLGVGSSAGTLAFNKQELRMEFALTVHRDKPAGRIAARYAISVHRDWRNLKRVTRLRGSVVALNRAAADTFLAVLATPLGQLMDSGRDEDHDYTSDSGATAVDVFTKLDFDDCYEDRLTGVTGVIEMRVSESVTYSATRWAVQPIPLGSNGGGGVSIPQACGQTEGSRVVRGTVSSASLATAQTWALRHRKMLTGDRDGGFYPQPESMEIDYDFAPRVDGIAEAGLNGSAAVNVQIYRVTFTFAEILPNYLPST